MAKDKAPALQYKTLPAYGVKSINEEEGIVEAFVAGIGNKDSVDDIIQPGAFIDSLKSRKPKGVWSHDWDRPVSKTLEIYEVDAGDSRLPTNMKTAGIGGLYVKTQFNLETQDGRDALSWVKFFGEESEWSIGYSVAQQKWDNEKKANMLNKVELFEYSPVLFGANPLTATVSAKVHVAKNADSGEYVVEIYGVEDENLASAIEKSVHTALGEADIKSDHDEIVEVQLEGVDPEMAQKITEAVEETVAASDEEGVPEEKTEEAEVEKADETEEVKEEESADEAASDEEEESEDGDEEESEEVEGEDEEGEEKSIDDSAFQIARSVVSAVKLTPEQADVLRKQIAANVDVKYIAGSYEARRAELCEALSEANPGKGVWPLATFDSTVVYEAYDYATGTAKEYEVSYSVGDDGVTFGEPAEVEVVEVVMAKQAIIDAIFKGYGSKIKSVLGPLASIEASEDDDVEIKDALTEMETKAGAKLSKHNKGLLQQAKEAIESVIGEAEEEVEEKSLEGESSTESEEEGATETEETEGEKSEESDELVLTGDIAELFKSFAAEKSDDQED